MQTAARAKIATCKQHSAWPALRAVYLQLDSHLVLAPSSTRNLELEFPDSDMGVLALAASL